MSTAVANGENRVAGSTTLPIVQTTGALTVVRQDPGAILSLAEKSGNPLDFLSKMGENIAKSGMLGLRKAEQGSTLLMICMTEGKTPLQVISEFHVMEDGKLARKADWVISRFREMGGSYTIIDDGEDNQKATYEFTFKGNTRKVSYTMDEAKAEKIVKKDSRWEKNPASMLRARVITKGVRMVAPEVMAGFYTEEELDGQTDGPSPVATSAPRGRPPKSATTEPAATAAQATGNASPSVAQQPAGEAGEVVDAEFQVTPDEPTASTAATAKTEEAPFDASKSAATQATEKPATSTATAGNSPEFTRDATILDIEFQLGRLGMSRADYEKKYFETYKNYKSLDDMPDAELNRILEKMRTVADQKTAKN